MSPVTHKQLIEHAVAAAAHAYSPYSKFSVGAALLAHDGRIFRGVNVENASYGLTLCAERSAFAAAIAAGVRQFEAIAIVASGGAIPSPCGACRQVMTEFCMGDFTVLMAALQRPETVQTYRLDALLPYAFSLNTTPQPLE